MPDRFFPALADIRIGQQKTQMIIKGLYVHEKEKKTHWKTTFIAEIHKDTDLIQKLPQMNFYSFRDGIIAQGEPAVADVCYQNRHWTEWQ